MTVVTVRVNTKPEYAITEKQWLESYYKYSANYPHRLVFIDRYTDGEKHDPTAEYLRYDLGGWDCGAWQFAGRNIDTDLLVCFNSSCRIMGDNWLKKFVEAVEQHGDGLYGPLTSYEILPHVRTPCMIFQPKVIQGYPKEVETREDTYRFECMTWPDGTPNFTVWAGLNGFKTMLVTWDGVYGMTEWRKPNNIFRRGDQSNLIVKDRHCFAYETSDAQGKAVLESLANGNPSNYGG